MITRLVGMMSAVLLVSLTAFAYLFQLWQQEVMELVAGTVHTVGSKTIAFLGSPEGAGLLTEQEAVDVLERLELPRAARHGDGGEGSTVAWVQNVCRVRTPEGEHDCADVDESEWTEMTAAGRVEVESDVRVRAAGQHEIKEIKMLGPDGSADHPRLHVLVEGVDSVAAPESGFLLRLSTTTDDVLVATQGEAPPPVVLNEIKEIHQQFRAMDRAHGFERKEFSLPIPTAGYDEKFAEMRQRSLLVSFGVLVFGTVAAASAATRVTRPIRKLDSAIRRLSGGELEVEVEVDRRDEVGRLARAFNIMTARLRANRERERALTRKEKLSALGRLAAGVAHDVRNPLHSIGLTLQHLSDIARPDGADRRAEFDRSVEIIRDEIRRLDRLVENFLTFARNDGGEIAPMNLPGLARDTLQLVHKEAERRDIELDFGAEGDAPEVHGDAEAVRAAVLNLVMNAFEAMPEGGQVRVGLSRRDREVALTVEDNGCGIPEDERERVFEFAYTTREDGSGLGLAMVHHVVVERHGGRVELDSELGRGTRVTLVFPATAEDADVE